jgi:hypothetical protein
LIKHDPFSLEAVGNINATGDPSGTLTSGTVSLGVHGTLNPTDTRHNITGYLVGTHTFGQNPPGSNGTNFGGALTLGYEYHFGGPSNDYPTFVLGANGAVGIQQSATVSAAGAPPGTPTPTSYLGGAYTVGAVGNASLNLGYYRQPGTQYGLSKVPRLTLFVESFVNYTGGSAVTLPDGSPNPSGGSTAAGANVGALYNFRLDGGRSVFSVGATVGPRWQWDTVGGTTYPIRGAYGGVVVGGAF